MLPTGLYIVATPIGNLQDVTQRAIKTLQEVDFIAAEDTRHSASLMRHLSVATPMIPLHEHNEKQAAQKIVKRLQTGESIALISDAGTPLISDPGYYLVAQVREAGFAVIPIVGACAIIAALCVSGIATDHFTFMGFLPSKPTQRRQVLLTVRDHPYTQVFYESPHRILACVEDMVSVLGLARRVSIARELTKTYETIYTAPLGEIQQWMQKDTNQQRGEFVVVVEGAPLAGQGERIIDQETENLLRLLLTELPINKAASLMAKISNYNKKALYQLALQLQGK